MDEQELEKKLEELRAKVGPEEMTERQRYDEDRQQNGGAGHPMHLAVKLAIFVGILVGSYLLYLLFARLGLMSQAWPALGRSSRYAAAVGWSGREVA